MSGKRRAYSREPPYSHVSHASTAGRGLSWCAFALLAGYFLVHIALRVMLSDSVELDEAEQIILTQELRLLYGSQPPLFFWIQALGFELLGLNVLALALTKHMVLFLGYVFVYESARIITGDTRCAVFAALSLMLFPQIGFESHRALSHSVMVSTTAAATVFALLRVIEHRRLADYVVLGLAIGLGMLSKYNYVMLGLPLLLAAGSIQRFRPALLDWRMLVTAGTTLAVFGPHLVAAATQPRIAARQSSELKIEHASTYIDALVNGGNQVLVSIAAQLAILIVFCIPIFLGTRSSPDRDPRIADYSRMLARAFAIAVLSVLFAMVILRIPEIKQRWFQPLLCILPLYVVARFGDRIDATRFRRLVVVVLLVGGAVLGTLYVRTAHPDLVGRYVRLNLPMGALASAVRSQGFDGGVIASDHREYSGALRLFFPGSSALSADLFVFNAPPGARWLVVWRASDDAQAPPKLAKLVMDQRDVALADHDPQQIEIPYRNSSTRTIAFDYVIIDP